jgi:hypothetical protein
MATATTPQSVEPNLSSILKDAEHLIIVCCHAIWLGGPTLGQDENEWHVQILLPSSKRAWH